MFVKIETGIYRNCNGVMSGDNPNRDRKSIDATQLNICKNDDPIENKRKSARTQAMKLISDAWKRDDKAYGAIKEMQDEKAAKVTEIQELQSKIKKIDESKEMLQQDYGVDKESQEQKDLELLEKYQNNITGASFDKFSKEEVDRLKELQNTPLTEYQKKALSLNAGKDALNIEIKKGENMLIAMSQSIHDSKIDRLKSQDMIKSQDAADKIVDAADEDILGLLIDESKQHIDDEAEKNEEKAEKIKKEKEEQEERIEESRERREEQEEILKGQREVENIELDSRISRQTVDHVSEAHKNIRKLMDENKLINEDIKGIEIDLNF